MSIFTGEQNNDKITIKEVEVFKLSKWKLLISLKFFLIYMITKSFLYLKLLELAIYFDDVIILIIIMII